MFKCFYIVLQNSIITFLGIGYFIAYLDVANEKFEK
jgi:hypothetical protein